MLYKRGYCAMHNIVDLLRGSKCERMITRRLLQLLEKLLDQLGRIYIGDALDCNDTNQRDNCQDSSQTVENPFARRYVDFQIVHRVVHTV